MYREKHAWRIIAMSYYTPRHKRTPWQWTLCKYGICFAIFNVGTSNHDEMLDKVNECLLGDEAYFCNYLPQNDKLRADWCYLQFLICCEKES